MRPYRSYFTVIIVVVLFMENFHVHSCFIFAFSSQQLHELQNMISLFQKNEAVNNTRVEPSTGVSFSDSKGITGNPE